MFTITPLVRKTVLRGTRGPSIHRFRSLIPSPPVSFLLSTVDLSLGFDVQDVFIDDAGPGTGLIPPAERFIGQSLLTKLKGHGPDVSIDGFLPVALEELHPALEPWGGGGAPFPGFEAVEE